MSDSDEDKTELPTGLRLSEARDQGNVPYSHEISGAFLLLISFGILKTVGPELMRALLKATRAVFSLHHDLLVDRPDQLATIGEVIFSVVKWTGPFFLAAFLVAGASGFMQVGFSISTTVISPKFDRLNPFANVGKLFSTQALVKIALSLVKMSIVGGIAYTTLAPFVDEVPTLNDEPLLSIFFRVLDLLLLLGLRVGGTLVVLGLADVFYRRWRHTKSLMMTKEEVKEEAKRSEGDPKIKGKIKDAQRAMARKRMRTDVKTADVVIRNPTHFAVALKYQGGKDLAPRVVAKGADLLALQIIRIAEEAGVAVVENRPLARELYKSVPLGEMIPERLFKAVAKILAAIYRKKNRRVAPDGATTAAARN